MIYTIPDQIGILACPGGAVFAGRVARELESIAREKMRPQAGRPVPEVWHRARGDPAPDQPDRWTCAPPPWTCACPPAELRPTHCRIPARFTRFANGEFKTEILTSIRNMDVYVIQDVENHYPLAMNRGDARALRAVGQRPHLLPVHRGGRGHARRSQAGHRGGARLPLLPAAQEEGPGRAVRGAHRAVHGVQRGEAHHHPGPARQGHREQLQPAAGGEPARLLPDPEGAGLGRRPGRPRPDDHRRRHRLDRPQPLLRHRPGPLPGDDLQGARLLQGVHQRQAGQHRQGEPAGHRGGQDGVHGRRHDRHRRDAAAGHAHPQGAAAPPGSSAR